MRGLAIALNSGARLYTSSQIAAKLFGLGEAVFSAVRERLFKIPQQVINVLQADR